MTDNICNNHSIPFHSYIECHIKTKMFKLLVASVLLASVYGDHSAPHPSPAPYHPPQPAPYHAPAPSYHSPKYEEPAQPYAFQYGVADDYSGSNFSAEENADGKITTGSYKVALPDGRIQTVSYTVDAYNGFVADVQYEGTPIYPKYEPKPSSYKPAPYHAPAPAPYHAPAPSYKV
ncbi:uncharacterized protein [Lepeophtheirus salmonis]|uniref:uncharacterized protein n=1 Tax=Lepeophtheirus salmonis TaxID=72036 RepID=UPI001AE9F690|nr:cuticle protein 7-like isoform X2 [Lepeophtheirus salmonis]